jgi:hypothetical protein
MAADRKLLAAAFAAIAFLTAGPARGAVTRPTPTAPAAGAVVQFLPSFAWTPVAGADKYQFQISADAGMNSPVLGDAKDSFFTRNTRASLTKTIPNGTYWWRVRATNAAGEISNWTQPRSFRKLWNLQPALQSPSSGAALSYPSNPVVLTWSGVPGAAHYLVSAASDPSLGSLVFHYANQDDLKGPPNVAATSAAITTALAPGSNYWSVTPVDAEGNRGVATQVASFQWLWPSSTTAQVTDLDGSPEVFDPKFSWNPVPGAAKYEIEINPSVDFAAGSKVCCSTPTIGTSLSPTSVLKDNVYYWRVRALDPDGNAGVWNNGPSFTKTFDNVPPVTAPAVKNLHMRDNTSDPGTDLDLGTPGYQTEVPIATWDPVPGASSYEADVAPYTSGVCNWTATSTQHHWRVDTAVNAWTPLGDGWNNVKPYSNALSVANELISLVPGAYCVRVRARSDRDSTNQDVYGDYTYIDDGTGRGTAFDWTGYPAPATAGCNSGYLCAGDYLTPVIHSTNTRTPYFTWQPLAGAQSYFVLVSKDPNFGTIVDYGFTHVPAYAPRTGSAARTYTDETTSYYWAVLPAQNYNGGLAVGNPLLAAAPDFQKQSTPPSLLFPSSVQVFTDQPSFRWTPAQHARRYRLQVATDPTFSNLLDDVTTDATSYTSNTTYPADTVLYWRVRADDENLVGLTWSATGTFQKTLPAPTPSAGNPTQGETLPVWSWGQVQGAASYDLSVDQPDGQHHDYQDIFTPAASFIKMTGTGVWHWRVRAEFPTTGSGTTPGPYSALQSFTRTIGEPANAKTDSAKDHVLLSWDPRLGVKEYKVQIASTPDFSRTVESVSTDNPSYAPAMTSYGYNGGGTLYWRVAGVDEDRNQGDWTQIQQIRLQPRLKVMVSGFARHTHMSSVRVTVLDGSKNKKLKGVRVRLTGAGIRAVAKKTNAKGQVTFKVKPRKKGKLAVSATKSGFQPAYGSVKVR